jgi:hypothetical protein
VQGWAQRGGRARLLGQVCWVCWVCLGRGRLVRRLLGAHPHPGTIRRAGAPVRSAPPSMRARHTGPAASPAPAARGMPAAASPAAAMSRPCDPRRRARAERGAVRCTDGVMAVRYWRRLIGRAPATKDGGCAFASGAHRHARAGRTSPVCLLGNGGALPRAAVAAIPDIKYL